MVYPFLFGHKSAEMLETLISDEMVKNAKIDESAIFAKLPIFSLESMQKWVEVLEYLCIVSAVLPNIAIFGVLLDFGIFMVSALLWPKRGVNHFENGNFMCCDKIYIWIYL